MQGLNGVKDGWETAACQNKKDYIQPNVGRSPDFCVELSRERILFFRKSTLLGMADVLGDKYRGAF